MKSTTVISTIQLSIVLIVCFVVVKQYSIVNETAKQQETISMQVSELMNRNSHQKMIASQDLNQYLNQYLNDDLDAMIKHKVEGLLVTYLNEEIQVRTNKNQQRNLKVAKPLSIDDQERIKKSLLNKIDVHIGTGMISETDMTLLQREMSMLSNANKKIIMSRLFKAMNDQQLEARL